MARPLRDRAAGIRHVVCRGNRRQPIFADALDRECYLGILARVRRAVGWRVLAWCLMTNHVHLVLEVPADSISRGMRLLCGGYAQGFNARHGLDGHLFQGRFRSEVVEDERYFLELVRYVDLNPERAGVVGRSADWPWSGHRAHVGLEPARVFHDVSWLRAFGATPAGAALAYAEFVEAGRRDRGAAMSTPATSGV